VGCRPFRRDRGRVIRQWTVREVDEAFVEPDDRAFPLAVRVEEDDVQLCEPPEFLVDVIRVAVDSLGRCIGSPLDVLSTEMYEFDPVCF
jgi:hypothetical protein